MYKLPPFESHTRVKTGALKIKIEKSFLNLILFFANLLLEPEANLI